MEKLSTDPRAVLDDPEIDAVLICSSTDTHADLVIAAAEKGKHVFCEKPVDLTVAKVKRALAAVEKAGVKLQIGFNRRFDHNFRRVRELVKAGAVGEPHIVRITVARPGAAAGRVREGLGRHLPGHDDPRLRHGPLPVRERGGGGVRQGGGAGGPGHRQGGGRGHGGGDADLRQRRARGDRQLAQGRLRLRPAGGGVRVEGERRRRPTTPRPRCSCRTRRGSRGTSRSTSSWSGTGRRSSTR